MPDLSIVDLDPAWLQLQLGVRWSRLTAVRALRISCSSSFQWRHVVLRCQDVRVSAFSCTRAVSLDRDHYRLSEWLEVNDKDGA